MNNPYKPPDSTVISKEESSRYRPSFGWKFYFWVSVVMFTLNILLFVVGSIFNIDLISYNAMDIVDFIVWSIATVAIFGLAWSRKLFRLNFWRFYLHIFILWFVVYSLVTPFVFDMPKYGVPPTLSDLYFETPFFLLTLWGLYIYSYKMDELWNNSKMQEVEDETIH